MLKKLSIYIDRLRDGSKDSIEENISTDDILGTDENFHFTSLICISGEAYLAGDHLILSLRIKLDVDLPCIICNNWAPYSINIENFLHTESMAKIKSGTYDYSSVIRDAVFLEIPTYFECNGNCPERAHLASHLTNKTNSIDRKTTPFNIYRSKNYGSSS